MRPRGQQVRVRRPRLLPAPCASTSPRTTFIGTWWTVERKPRVEEVAKHIGALAWMGLRHLPKRPAFEAPPD